MSEQEEFCVPNVPFRKQYCLVHLGSSQLTTASGTGIAVITCHHKVRHYVTAPFYSRTSSISRWVINWESWVVKQVPASVRAIVGLVPEYQASIRLRLLPTSLTFLFPLPPIYALLATLHPALWGSKQPQDCVAPGLLAISQEASPTPARPNKHSFAQLPSLPAPHGSLTS